MNKNNDIKICLKHSLVKATIDIKGQDKNKELDKDLYCQIK